MGDSTPTIAVPIWAIRPAGIDAVTCVEETKVVGWDEPFHVINVELVKLLPFAVRVKPGPPDSAPLGVMLVRVSGPGVTVKFTAFEVWFAFFAVIAIDPGSAIKAAGTAAVT